MSTTVHVTSISPQTTKVEVHDFFSFCGKISNLSLSTDSSSSQSAAVTFEQPSAAKTALLLDSTQIGPSTIHVSAAASLEEMSSPKAPTPATEGDHDTIQQEDKPRSRIVAEYLAHGYTISDKAIERALALDNQHGVSSRFTSALANFDKKYKATEKAQSIDTKYGVSDKAYQGWATMNSYFEKAMGTPSGQKVRAFYQDGSKQVMDVHSEARRLADLKAGKAPTVQVPGTSLTTCQCQAESGKCGCAPGQCACASCPKNISGTHTTPEGVQPVQGTEGKMTTCNCGAELGKCPCEPGKCTCANCPKSSGGSDPGLYKMPTGHEGSAGAAGAGSGPGDSVYEREKAQADAMASGKS